MDRSAAEEEDYNDEEEEEEEMVMEDELRIKFVFDVAPLEIIDKEDDQDFNINQINLVIHVIDHQFIYQYWSLKSDHQQLNSSSCSHQHHHDYHHLRDDYDDDKEMIMIICQPTCPPEVITGSKLVIDIGAVFTSHDHQNVLLNHVDLLYECERIPTYEDLEKLKKCITQRISEAKPALLLMAKPKTLRIRVDLSTILKRYYANSTAANSAAAQIAIELSECAEDCALLIDHDHYSAAPQEMNMTTFKPASRLSREALETKIFDKKDLTSSSCPVCLNEFHVGVDEVKKMPCSHVFHWTCLMEWLVKRNTCPLCRYELPTFWESFHH